MDKNVNQHLKKLKSAYTGFIQIAHQLDAGKRYQPGVCGQWSPKDVVSHLVGWDKSLKTFIVVPSEFGPPGDVQRFNAQSVASRASLSWQEVMDELEENFVDLEQALVILTSEMQIYRRVIEWISGRTEDYELHKSQLEAWLA